MGDIETIDKSTDLVFSPDDGGFYFHRYSDDKVSHQTFKSRREALQAYKDKTIVWED